MEKRILVLDDNQDILEIVETVLEYEGYEVICTSKTTDFERLLNAWNPHTVIIDYRLADGNGGDVCRYIKENEQTKHIPVILFSAYINREEDFAHLGCDEVITKPFDLQVLADRVKKVLS